MVKVKDLKTFFIAQIMSKKPIKSGIYADNNDEIELEKGLWVCYWEFNDTLTFDIYNNGAPRCTTATQVI